jgi:hypothetical protein
MAWVRVRTMPTEEKLVPTSADRGCHMVGVAESYGRILDFLDSGPFG